ncbi:hypothetical protein AVEN_59090-1 [Araneus ventricosus]|uniref:Uncharacterized protein n=1 Tax=Araneus ventricosus TaxID=182803 RepID=A0A4Y2KT01_ARAVE|nr:hypothetical protein AVEN_59090-1 [Araneus ventricosus]
MGVTSENNYSLEIHRNKALTKTTAAKEKKETRTRWRGRELRTLRLLHGRSLESNEPNKLYLEVPQKSCYETGSPKPKHSDVMA